MSDLERLQRFLRTDPRDVGCDEAMAVLHISVDLVAAGQDVAGCYPGGRRSPAGVHRAPPAPLEASAGFPPAASARRHRFADIRDPRNRLVISPSLAPASINSAAASRTCSRRARSAAVSPPPSGYLMAPAYPARQPSAEPVTPAFKIVRGCLKRFRSVRVPGGGPR
jgi:hypothetical protein